MKIGVISPVKIKSGILDRVGPPVDRGPTPPMQNGQNEINRLWRHELDLGVLKPVKFKSRIHDRVGPTVDHGPTPPTQNGQNEIMRLWGHQLEHRGNLIRTIQISHLRPRQTTRWPWTNPAHAKWSKLNNPIIGATNLDLRVIWPIQFKFRILDRIRPPVDRRPTPPTPNGQNEIIRLWGYQLGTKGNLTRTILFRILERVRPTVDLGPTPATQNGRNEIFRL